MTARDQQPQSTEGDYTPPVVLPPDDASVEYPLPWPEYVPPMGAEVPVAPVEGDSEQDSEQ